MAPDITARDLMRLAFLRLGAAHTLREALAILLDPEAQQADGPRVLVVLHPDGTFAGTLTMRFLLRALTPHWATDEESDDMDFEARLLAAVQDRLDLKVTEAMNRDALTVGPDERLPRLVEAMQEKRLDCVPVIEDDRVAGVIFLTDVFSAAARLALGSQSDSPQGD